MGEDERVMTDLISRATRRTASPEREPGLSVTLTGALAGLVAAGSTLAVTASLALTGWFLADGGAHGRTTDALRVGAELWLAGHGADIVLAGIPIGMPPLLITLILLNATFRSGRWAAGHLAGAEEVRQLLIAGSGFVCAYLLVAVGVGVLVAEPGTSLDLQQVVLGGLLVSVAGGAAGLAVGSGIAAGRWLELPGWVRDVVRAAVAGALGLVVVAGLMVTVALLIGFNEAATVVSELDLGPGDALSYLVVLALFVPNSILFGAAYLLGPGFAFGTGTTVAPTTVSLGVVPAVPLLAALPEPGPQPGWHVLIMAVPALTAAWAAWSLAEPAPALDLAALRGAAAGFGAGILLAAAIGLAGGPLGTGRLADVGAPFFQVLVFATGLMTAGGALGAVAHSGWARRGR